MDKNEPNCKKIQLKPCLKLQIQLQIYLLFEMTLSCQVEN